MGTPLSGDSPLETSADPPVADRFHGLRTSRGSCAKNFRGKFGDFPWKSGDFRKARGAWLPQSDSPNLFRDIPGPDNQLLRDPDVGISRTRTLCACKWPFSVVLDSEWPPLAGMSRNLGRDVPNLEKLYARNFRGTYRAMTARPAPLGPTPSEHIRPDLIWTRFGPEIALSGQNRVQIRSGRMCSEGGRAQRGGSGCHGPVGPPESLDFMHCKKLWADFSFLKTGALKKGALNYRSFKGQHD